MSIKKPHDKFPAFLMDMAKNGDVAEALQHHYGFSDIAAAQKEFSRFCR